jgi:Carboxypeptidase regulatory-like domain
VFAVLPLLLHAQIQPPSSITIRGVVVSTEDQKPVPDVSVTLDEARRTAMTNASGGFEFKDVPGESQDIVVAKKAGFLCAFQGLPTPHCIQSLSSVPYEDIDMTNPKKITITVTLTMMPEAIVQDASRIPRGSPSRACRWSCCKRACRTEDMSGMSSDPHSGRPMPMANFEWAVWGPVHT